MTESITETLVPAAIPYPSSVRLGRIEDEPIDVYHRTPAISNSKLADFAAPTGRPSLFYEKHVLGIREQQAESPALFMGNVADCLVLEGPEAMDRRYVINPRPHFGDMRIKVNKEAQAKWELLNTPILEQFDASVKAGKIPVSQEDYAFAMRLREAVLRNKIARAVLACGKPQITWRIRMPHFLVQCRTDYFVESASAELAQYLPVNEGDALFVDLKTTDSLDEEGYASFWKQVRQKRYYRQLALYREVIQPILKRPIAFACLIAVEKTPPYECGVYVPPEKDMQLGIEEILWTLRNLQLCAQKGVWPGVPQDQVVPLPLKEWHHREVAGEMERASALFATLQELPDRQLTP